MDLRDQFAIAAMQGLLMSNIKDRELVSIAAYEQADAMIAEREKYDIESLEEIKQILVDATKEKHSGLNTSAFLPAKELIFQLKTGLPF